MKQLAFLFVFVIARLHGAHAQDTLPRFSVVNAGANRVIVGWVNTLGAMRQISVQRSHDSLTGYKTILSVADPNAIQNGFADTKAPNDHMFYRLFYVVGTGEYYFTAAKKPVRDTASQATSIEDKFSDSATLTGKTPPAKKDSVLIKNPGFVPSFYVYTNNTGDVYINLPDADRKEYSLKFFDESNAFLFDIKAVKESGLTLDKSNFYHAGWFYFELYSDDKLVERHKFYLTRAINFSRKP